MRGICSVLCCFVLGQWLFTGVAGGLVHAFAFGFVAEHTEVTSVYKWRCDTLGSRFRCRCHTHATTESPAPVVEGSPAPAPAPESSPTDAPVAGKPLRWNVLFAVRGNM